MATKRNRLGMLQFILWTAAFAGSFASNNWTQLRGRHFRVSAFLAPPYLFEVNRGNVSEFDGVNKGVFDFVFHHNINASYEFVLVNPKEVEAKGYVQASIDQLLNGEVDISSFGYIPTKERSKIMDFSGPVLIPQHVLTVPYPKEKSKLAGIIRPFQIPVWIVFLLTSGFLVAMLSILSKCYLKHSANNDIRPRSFVDHCGDNIIYVLTVLVGNGEYYRGRQLWLRLVLSSWCLACVVIINAYTGNLTSYLTVPAKESIPNSFEELAVRKDLHLALAKNSILADIVLKSSTPPLKTLGDRLRRNPEYLFRTQEDQENYLATNKIVVAMANVEAISAVNTELKKHRECRLTYSKPLSLYFLYVYGFPKDWPYKEAFNSRLQYIWETGLVDKLFRIYLKQEDQCLLKKKEPPHKATMKLESFYGAFVLLAAGFSVSLLAFLLELIAAKVKKGKWFGHRSG